MFAKHVPFFGDYPLFCSLRLFCSNDRSGLSITWYYGRLLRASALKPHHTTIYYVASAQCCVVVVRLNVLEVDSIMSIYYGIFVAR